jgi:hypothetical protein
VQNDLYVRIPTLFNKHVPPFTKRFKPFTEAEIRVKRRPSTSRLFLSPVCSGGDCGTGMAKSASGN